MWDREVAVKLGEELADEEAARSRLFLTAPGATLFHAMMGPPSPELDWPVIDLGL